GCISSLCTSPIPQLLVLRSYRLRPGAVRGATAFGAVLLLAAVGAGAWVQGSPLRVVYQHSHNTIALGIMVYGFVASVLPVWLLLCPRDYLSSFMKVGAVVLLAIGVILVSPRLHMPPVPGSARGGGLVSPGT